MKLRKRLIALLVCLVMVLGMLPTGILAAEAPAGSINFMDAASAEQYTVINQRSAKVNAGSGLYLVSTKDAFEPCNGQVSSFNPTDVVSIPAEGDFTATLKFTFDAGSSPGYYEFFGFYAAAGEDYQNLAGIRAGNKAMQDFLRKSGTVTADTDGLKTSAGLLSASAHWLRIAREGDDYTCFWSTDGTSFNEIFSYADTGIEADRLLIDAYTGMSTGYNYTLEYLYFGTDSAAAEEYFGGCRIDGALDAVVSAIPEELPTNALDLYVLPAAPKGCEVSYSCDDARIAANKIYAESDIKTEIALTVTVSIGSVSKSETIKVRLPAKGANRPASDTNVHYIGFTSDIHTAVSGNNGFSGLLNSLTNRYTLDYFCFGGDYSWNNSLDDLNSVRALMSPKISAGKVLGGGVYTMGNHECYDNQGSVDSDYGPDMIQCGEAARNDDYRIFCFGAKANVNEGYWYPEDIAELDAYMAATPRDIPVFIIAHYALHRASGNDNFRTPINSIDVIDVLNKYPNAIYVWAHNHSMGDKSYGTITTAGTTLYYSETDARDLNFTIASNGACRDGAEKNVNGMVATLETTDEARKITFTYYTNGGSVVGSPATITLPRYTGDPETCEHDYSATVIPANCTAGGYTVKTCKKCGDSLYDDILPALGHDTDDVVTVPTCTKVGFTTHSCKTCGCVYNDSEIRALGHTFVDGICTVCGADEASAGEGNPDIDFTKTASSDLFQVVNYKSSAIQDGVGIKLRTTRPAFETCNGQNSGNQANNPEDVVKIPVAGDWSATLNFDFSKNGISNGYYQFFGFYAAAGEDYQNLVGIRGGDDEFQDFRRLEGAIYAERSSSAPGLSSDGNYWLRLTKVGTSYTAARSDDGETFTDMFSFRITGIDADYILIDAYTGQTEGYIFTLKSLDFEPAELPCEHDYEAVVTAPTCTEGGFTTYTCTLCGDSYVADEVAAAGHKFEGGKCTVCGEKDPDWVEPKACPSEAFPDVPEKGNWAHEGIDYCIDKEYMNGTGNGLFSPDGDVTRAQLVTIIYRIEGEPETEFKGTFADVEDGLWYSKAIEWAAANGIVNGVGEGRFDPTGVITREQIATIFFRYAKAAKGEADLSIFPDAGDAHSYAVDALSWAVDKGIITGVKANDVTYLKPLNNASRAQIASIIMRYLGGGYKCGE